MPGAPAISAASTWLGVWSRPPDTPARCALAAAIALVVLAVIPGGPGWLAASVDLAHVSERSRRRRFLAIVSLGAAFLSLGYVAFYLRGGPRATEAATYWVQGRAMSHAALSWSVAEPSATSRAHDLLLRAPDRMSGAMPPGYPALLALGFVVGAPMLIGPLLAAAIVFATWFLAREVFARAPGQPASPDSSDAWVGADPVAHLAAGLSVVSASLRYHTADARPEGAMAAAAALSLACALRALRLRSPRLFAVSGLALGFLAACSPGSAATLALPLAALALGAFRGAALPRPTGPAASVGWMCAGALPGLLLLLAANRAATGHLFASPAAAYALFAHEAPARMALAAIAHGARAHLLDVANLEPLALLGLVPFLRAKDRPGVVPLAASAIALAVAGVWLAGARVTTFGGSVASPLVTLLPLEHVLVALGVARAFGRATAAASVAVLGLAVGGFSVHAAYAHEAIAGDGIGRPAYEPDIARESNVTHGLLLFNDDDGFELAYDPAATASHGVQAARIRGDDHDRLLDDTLGRPPVHRYIGATSAASIASWAPMNGGSELWRFETENDWPPIAASGGWAEVMSGWSPCASDGRAVRVSPTGKADAIVTLPLPVPPGPKPEEARTWIITPRVVQHGDGGAGALALVAEPGQAPLAEWTWEDASKPTTCIELAARTVDLGGPRPHAWLVVRARGGPVALDRTTMRLR